MKKTIAALCLTLILSLSLVACGGNNDDKDTDTTNEGMITETGTDTNIVDRARSMVDGVESGIDGMMR
ncbi:MAG: hypothetical protein IKB02_08405 [Clostridia bacterium]|nr:hypothetical protein [Clostridia bacterium]